MDNSKFYTPHIKATPDDFAKTVLMPGDPLRAKFIAETFLENAKLVNNVRGIHGYTGEWKGQRVSVMASGMGMPSIGIYSYELYNFFGVDNIIRIGSAGGIADKLRTDQTFFYQRDALPRVKLAHFDVGEVVCQHAVAVFHRVAHLFDDLLPALLTELAGEGIFF